MEFRDSPREAEFRATVRAFLDGEYPPEYADRPTEWGLFNGAGRAQAGFQQFMRGWTAKLNEHGWGAPAWPKEHGGGGLSVKEPFILSEEFAWRRAPPSGGIGHGWAGPTIMVYGTEDQKAAYLPKIISGEHIWCQLFSEPGAGSDLAALQTRAIRDGDDYVVNGQKIWTSGAQHAHMGILIARTNPDAPKHRGVSYFLVDMKTPIPGREAPSRHDWRLPHFPSMWPRAAWIMLPAGTGEMPSAVENRGSGQQPGFP